MCYITVILTRRRVQVTCVYLFLQKTFFMIFLFSKGCQNFVSIDGIWKLRHPHCLYPVKAEVSGLPTINYPNVCTVEPETQASAFCAEHSQLAKAQNIPTILRQFIHDYCKVSRNDDGMRGIMTFTVFTRSFFH